MPLPSTFLPFDASPLLRMFLVKSFPPSSFSEDLAVWIRLGFDHGAVECCCRYLRPGTATEYFWGMAALSVYELQSRTYIALILLLK